MISHLDQLTESTDIAEIERAFGWLEQEEARMDVEISEAVEASHEADTQFARVHAVQDDLNSLAEQLRPLQLTIDQTAANAGSISGRVRYLDRQRTKLEQALGMVEETVVFKQRLVELLAAIQDKNIDQAAALLHKCRTVDSQALSSPLVVFAQPTGSAARTPELIADATRELMDRVTFMFEAAVESNNTREISRCFRLFPLLGEETLGLDMYSEFLCSTIADKSRITGQLHTNLYALRLTRLFEVLAVVIDNHFPVVETHYGPGRMLRVIQRLQIEGAKRAAMVVDFFEEERQVKRRLAQIEQAEISDREFQDISNTLSELVLLGRQIAAFNRFMESRAAPEVEALAEEGTRDKVYMKPEAALKLMPLAMTSGKSPGAVEFNSVTGLIEDTPLRERMSWLTNTYVTLESYFINRSVAKAMALDNTESLSGWTETICDTTPAGGTNRQQRSRSAALTISTTSSCVGDVFFVSKTALSNAISIQEPTAVESISRLLISAFNSVLLATLEQRATTKWNKGSRPAPRGSNELTASGGSEFGNWRLPGVLASAKSGLSASNSNDSRMDEDTISPKVQTQRLILVSINNLDLATQYTQKTVESLQAMINREWDRVPDKDHITRAHSALDTFGAFGAKFAYARQQALERVVGAQALKPQIRSILQQSYRDIKYVLTDEEFNDMQNDNLFQKRFMLKFGQLVTQLRERLSDSCLKMALDICVASLATDWERAIKQSKFNMLGGFMFEKDVREIQKYLEQETDQLLRSVFVRLIQCADVLAIEGPEDVKRMLETSSGSTKQQDMLNKEDIRALLDNRIDVDMNAIDGL